MRSHTGRGTRTSHTRGHGWSPPGRTRVQWGGLALVPPAAFSLPSPAATSTEEAEPWHRCCATPVSAPVEGRRGARHWAIWIYTTANLGHGFEPALLCLGASLPYHGHWDQAWRHQGWVGRVDEELLSTLLGRREFVWSLSFLHPKSGDHVGSQGWEGAK